MVHTVVRAAPWLVSVAAAAGGYWFIHGMTGIVARGPLAAVGIGLVIARAVVALGAISIGAFVLSRGLLARWEATDDRQRRRYGGLAVLGGVTMILGASIVIGPFAGVGFVRSLAFVGATAMLAGSAIWSSWSLSSPRGGSPQRTEPLALEGDRVPEAWMLRDLGRAKTPVA